MDLTANLRKRLLGRARLWLVGAIAMGAGATVAFAGAAATNQQAQATGTAPASGSVSSPSGSTAGGGVSNDNPGSYGTGQQDGGSTGLAPGGNAASHGSSHAS